MSVPVAALLLTACSSESVVENLAEEAAERATDGDVQIDTEEGSLTVETEDGTSTLTQTEELPPEFPSDIPVPDDFVASTVQTSDSDGSRGLIVQGDVGALEPAYELIIEGLPAAGYEVTIDSGGAASRQIQFTGPDGLTGIVGLTGDDEDTFLQYILSFGD